MIKDNFLAKNNSPEFFRRLFSYFGHTIKKELVLCPLIFFVFSGYSFAFCFLFGEVCPLPPFLPSWPITSCSLQKTTLQVCLFSFSSRSLICRICEIFPFPFGHFPFSLWVCFSPFLCWAAVTLFCFSSISKKRSKRYSSAFVPNCTSSVLFYLLFVISPWHGAIFLHQIQH